MSAISSASLYTGFDGFGVGAKAAGLELAWGLELLPRVAEVANANLGNHVRVGDILEADPFDFDYVDILHASTICKRFSQANKMLGERPEDVAHARKVVEFVTVLRPRIFTLENVWLYRFSKSMRIIENALHDAGYWLNIELCNMADYGVPQTRKRLILRAMRGGFVPHLPIGVGEWNSWYSAVADLLDDMPECELAPWQLKLMPAELTTMLIGNQRVSDGSKERAALGCVDATQPSMTLTTKNSCNLKVFLVDGANSSMRKHITVREGCQPAFTLTTGIGSKQPLKVAGAGRTVQLSMRGAARLQSFPDWYELPDSRELAGFGIGNAVPPLAYQRIIEGLVQSC